MQKVIRHRKQCGKPYSYNEVMNMLRREVDIEFYEKMSKQVSLEGFDVEKYLSAMKNYTGPQSFETKYQYYNNAMERGAYQKERLIYKAFGVPSAVNPDFFPRNYKKMVSVMTKNEMPKDEQETLLKALNAVVLLKSERNPSPKFKKLLELSIRKFVYNNLTELENVELSELSSNRCLAPRNFDAAKYQECWSKVESLMNEGKLTLREILQEL